MTAAAPAILRAAHVNILMLTSEFAPATGGIGTYAREIASAADPPRRAGDGGGSGLRTSTGGRRRIPALRSACVFPAACIRCGICPQKSCWRAARSAIDRYDVIHAADWPFFIPLALSRWRYACALADDRARHRDQRNADAARSGWRSAAPAYSDRGPRSSPTAATPASLFRERFAIDARRVSAVRLGVSDFWFGHAQTARRGPRRHIGWRPDRLVMVTVARLTRRKGHHLTLVGAGRAARRFAQAHHLAGDRSGRRGRLCRERYGAWPSGPIAMSACSARCRTKRSATSTARPTSSASPALPDPSGRVEGFGLVYLEAAAGGLPSVATAIGGVPDAVLAGETGILVPPDVESISKAIADLAGDHDLRANLAGGASVHARNLSWERCAAATYGLSCTGDRAQQAIAMTA